MFCGVKELNEIERCIEKGLLRKIPPSIHSAKAMFDKAEKILVEAKAHLKEGKLFSASVIAYLAMFNAAKALLLKDGYREKSHYCVARYLESYVADGKLERRFVDMFDRFRSNRHVLQYEGEYLPILPETKAMVEFAEEFVSQIRKLAGC